MTRVLVVEDENMVRENVLELLRVEGYTTLSARDGEDGVRIARKEIPDLILCDISMPQMDGFGVLARLSHDPLTAAIPFIFLTGRIDWLDQRTGMKLGADDYITKPFIPADLIASVKRRLEKKKALLDLAGQRLEELKSKIERGMPFEMLAPLSVLLANSEALYKSDWVATDASQVRNSARDIHGAAVQLARLVQNYTFYGELENLAADPLRKSRLKAERTLNCAEIVCEMAKSAAAIFDRNDDLRLVVETADLRVSELFLQIILEELMDRALIHSLPGSGLEVQGKTGIQGMYSLRIRDQGGRFPADAAASGSRSFEKGIRPVGLLLVQRIIELVDGELNISTDQTGSLVEIDLPMVVSAA